MNWALLNFNPAPSPQLKCTLLQSLTTSNHLAVPLTNSHHLLQTCTISHNLVLSLTTLHYLPQPLTSTVWVFYHCYETFNYLSMVPLLTKRIFQDIRLLWLITSWSLWTCEWCTHIGIQRPVRHLYVWAKNQNPRCYCIFVFVVQPCHIHFQTFVFRHTVQFAMMDPENKVHFESIKGRLSKKP